MPEPIIKNIKIVSDGTSEGTKVYDQEGRTIGLIKTIQLRVDADKKMTEMFITCVGPALFYSGESKFVLEKFNRGLHPIKRFFMSIKNKIQKFFTAIRTVLFSR